MLHDLLWPTAIVVAVVLLIVVATVAVIRSDKPPDEPGP